MSLAALASPATVHGPGTYAHYHVDQSAAPTADDMIVEHVWETIPSANVTRGNAVFASMQFWFENGVGGYFGTQAWRAGAIDERGRRVAASEATRVIFSVWDAPGGGKVGWKGDGCGRFGGEGVGSHCVVPQPLVPVNAYSLMVRRVGHNGTGDWWTASVSDVKARGPAIDFGSLWLPDTPNRTGFGRLQTKAAAFQEYFEATGCADQPLSSVGLLGPWWNKASLTPTQAYADYAKQCPYSDVGACIYGAGCGVGRVLFTAGGATVRKHTNVSEPLW